MLKLHKSCDREIFVSSFLFISALLFLWFLSVFSVWEQRIVGPSPSPSVWRNVAIPVRLMQHVSFSHHQGLCKELCASVCVL